MNTEIHRVGDATQARLLDAPDEDGNWVLGDDEDWQQLALDLIAAGEVKHSADTWNGPVLWKCPNGQPYDQPTANALDSLLAAEHIWTTVGCDVHIARREPTPIVELGRYEFRPDGTTSYTPTSSWARRPTR